MPDRDLDQIIDAHRSDAGLTRWTTDDGEFSGTLIDEYGRFLTHPQPLLMCSGWKLDEHERLTNTNSHWYGIERPGVPKWLIVSKRERNGTWTPVLRGTIDDPPKTKKGEHLVMPPGTVHLLLREPF